MSQDPPSMPQFLQRMALNRPELDPDILAKSELLYSVHELSRLISTYFDRVMAPHDLTHAQWWTIMHVMFHEGKSQAELARVMQMGRSAAGKLLERLEEKGWIERRPDEDDHRLLRVYMKTEALPDLKAFELGGDELFSTFLHGVDSAQMRATLAGLRLIQSNGEEAMKQLARAEKIRTREAKAKAEGAEVSSEGRARPKSATAASKSRQTPG